MLGPFSTRRRDELETERKQGPRPDPVPEAASQLAGNLRLRLARLRKSGDPRASAVASQCNALLDTIDRELDALVAERRR